MINLPVFICVLGQVKSYLLLISEVSFLICQIVVFTCFGYRSQPVY